MVNCFLKTIAVVAAVVLGAGPVVAQVGPGPVPSAWGYNYPDVYFNKGGVRMPYGVTGGGKGVGSINISGGYYVNGVQMVGSVASTAPANQFATGQNSSGLLYAQPTFTNLGGVLLSTQIPAFTGAFTCSGLTCTLAPGVAAANLGAGLGTSGATIGLLNASKTDSGNNTFTGTNAFSGTLTAVTPTAGDNSLKVPTTAMLVRDYAPLASPAFTGTPTAPTQSVGDNSTKLATTAFAQANRSRVLLNTLTASGQATLSDTTSITGTYTNYVIEFDNVVPATNNAYLQLLVQQSGAFATSGYTGGLCNSTGSATSCAGDTADMQVTSNIGSTSVGASGSLRFNNPASTGKTVFQGTNGHNNGTPALVTNNVFNMSPTGAITGLQFKMSSGTIASGVIRIYGTN